MRGCTTGERGVVVRVRLQTWRVGWARVVACRCRSDEPGTGGVPSPSVCAVCCSDIPDAEVKPPENVLFVCKLNPITTDEVRAAPTHPYVRDLAPSPFSI